MRPRWALHNVENMYAALISPQAPYGLLIQLTDRIITDLREDDSEPVNDQVVGFIVHPGTGKFAAAELINDEHYRFINYINANDPQWKSNPAQLTSYANQLVSWGQHWASSTAPLPTNIQRIIEDDPEEDVFQPQGRQRRGQQKRRAT